MNDPNQRAVRAAQLGMDGLAKVVANMIGGIADLIITINNMDTAKLVREIAESKIPFDTKVQKLEEAFDKMPDAVSEHKIHDFCNRWQAEHVSASSMRQENPPQEMRALDFLSRAGKENVPFSTRLKLLEQAKDSVSNDHMKEEIDGLIKDLTKSRSKIQDGMDKIKEAGYSAKEGMREMVDYIDSLSIPEEEKEAFRATAARCEAQGRGLCVTAFSADEAQQALALMNAYKVSWDPSTHILRTPDGGLRVITDNVYEDTMRTILGISAWELGRAQNPDRARYEADAYARAKNKEKSAIISAKFQSPEDGAVLAAVAARWLNEGLGGKKAATDITYDENGQAVSGQVIIATDGAKKEKGQVMTEDDKAYAALTKGVAAASMLLAGPGSDYVKKQVTHELSVEKQIRDAIDACSRGEAGKGGTVFVSHYDENGFYTSDTHIQFDEHGFTPTYNGIENLTQPNLDEAQYRSSLLYAVENGTTEKVFVPEEQLKALQQNAIQWQKELNSQIASGIPIADIYKNLMDEGRDKKTLTERAETRSKIKMLFYSSDLALADIRKKQPEEVYTYLSEQEKAGNLHRKLVSRSSAVQYATDQYVQAKAFHYRNREEVRNARNFERALYKAFAVQEKETKHAEEKGNRGPFTFISRVKRPDIGKESEFDGRDVDKVINEIGIETFLQNSKDEALKEWQITHPDAFANLGVIAEDNITFRMDSLHFGFDITPTPESERGEEKSAALRQQLDGQELERPGAVEPEEPEKEQEPEYSL